MMQEMTSTANDGALAKAMGSLFTAAVLTLVAVSTSVEGGSVNDCHGVRYAYRERGLDLKDVPRQPRQGKISGSTLNIIYVYIGDTIKQGLDLSLIFSQIMTRVVP